MKAAKALVAEGRYREALASLRGAVRDDSDFVSQARAAKVFASIPPGALGLRTLRVALLASSTVDHLADVLRLWLAFRGIEATIHIAPYDTVEQTVLDTSSALYAFDPQLVWIFSTARDVDVAVEPGADAATIDACIQREVDRRATLWRQLASRLDCPVLQNNADIPADDAFGHMAGAMPWGRRTMLRRYNAALVAAAPPGVIVFDLDYIASSWGTARWNDARMWFHSKHAFSLDAAGMVASRAASLVAGLVGLAKKCLVLDLDDTLWGGVVGDDGVAGIRIGNGADGEAFAAFQRYVRSLKDRGIVLAVCSKNELAAARAPFEQLADMALALDDIAVFRANWEDKATNIRAIAATLGLGLDSIVFVDDNPVERDLVRTHLPEVEVLEMPEDPALFVETLARSGYFEAAMFSEEDRARAAAYAANAQRAQARESVVDMASYLRGLDMKAHVRAADEVTLPRIAQLIGKSNQFHLTGVRPLEPELRALRESPDHRVLGFRLADRFGDNGLISACALRRADDAVHIDIWVMSCRVLGRTMEEFVANEILRVAHEWHCRTIVGRYVPSPKNTLVAGLYPRLGFQQDADGMWRLHMGGEVPRWETHIVHSTNED